MKRRKPTPNKKDQLQADWEKLHAAHSKPLERGAKAKGVGTISSVSAPNRAFRRTPDSLVGAASLNTTVNATTVKIEDAEMLRVKRELAARTGQAYNKGGIQLLTDLDMQEQRSGSHRRRS